MNLKALQTIMVFMKTSKRETENWFGRVESGVRVRMVMTVRGRDCDHYVSLVAEE